MRGSKEVKWGGGGRRGVNEEVQGREVGEGELGRGKLTLDILQIIKQILSLY